ncbi:MAG: hypothetical protein MJA28_16345 [Gammaproteobacteria bacterium]|nr:hypothetical protein [Gammaproteobacteria bacterium]
MEDIFYLIPISCLFFVFRMHLQTAGAWQLWLCFVVIATLEPTYQTLLISARTIPAMG